ncbi:MAG: AAA family ATPase [Streptosporangiaceae bacterium]
MTVKPEHIFDREREWEGLDAFARNAYSGAMLGVVSGRRRQGKSFLLEALASATGGLYFPAVEATEMVSLRAFTTALVRQGISVSRPVQDWDNAIALLFSAVTGQPRVAVIDEFPFLAKASPSLPSIIQRELGPGGSGQRSSVRLLLCGSAMSVMGACLRDIPRCVAGPPSNCSYARSATGRRRVSGGPPTRSSRYCCIPWSAVRPPTGVSSSRSTRRTGAATSTPGCCALC